MIMHYSCENLLLKVIILLLALCYGGSGSSSIILGNAYINNGMKIPSTGRAFEYDSYPTYNTGQSAKGFGVPRAVSHSVPDDVKQAPTISPEIKMLDTPKSKDTSDITSSDDINIDGKQTREGQKQETQPMSLYSTIKLIRDKATEHYNEGRILKGFGFGGGGWKLGR